MTIYLVFAALALVHFSLLVWSARSHSFASRWRLLYLRVLLAGLLLDNTVLTLGHVLNGTPLFDPATRLRFFMHATILPFLTLYTLSIMKQVEVKWARLHWFRFFCIGLTLCSLCYGLMHEVIELGALKVIQPKGAFRMTAVSGNIPLGTILTNFFMIIFSILIFLRGGPSAFLMGSAGIFLINGTLTGNSYGFIFGSAAEVFFVVCLLVGERALGAKDEWGPSEGTIRTDAEASEVTVRQV